MKKIFKTLVIACMGIMALAACEDVPAPFALPTEPENPSENPDANDGTVAKPFSVAELQSHQTGTDVWVHGYIVGSVPAASDGSSTYLENMTFTATGANNANICIADTPTESSYAQCVAVQLPSAVRAYLSLASKPENLGKEVWLKGSAEKYYGAAGMKNVSKYSFTQPTTDEEENPGGDTPAGEVKGDGTLANPFNVAGILALTKALPADTNSDKEYYFKGIICDVPNVDTGSYGNATFSISDDGSEANSFMIYRGYSFNREKFTSADVIKKGDEVVICGYVVNYKGNTPETATGKAYLVTVNGKGDEGDQPSQPENPGQGSQEGVSIDGTTVTLTNAAVTAGSESLTVDLSTLGFDNAETVTTLTLTDGTTVTFDANTNQNPPKYYDATKGIRVYANNTITFRGLAPIAKVVMTCDEYNGTKYVGNATATLEANGNTMVYTNATTESAGVQLRVKTITVVYAQ